METQNLTILTKSDFLYGAFKYENPIEQYYGVIQFKDSVIGLLWHVKFVDFCNEFGIKLLQTDYSTWRNTQLSNRSMDFELYKNCCSFIIHNEESYLDVIKTLQIVFNQVNSPKKKQKNVQKSKQRNS